MGMEIFTSSGTFDPAAHGLQAGDLIQIIAVGGGAGGDYSGGTGGGLSGKILIKSHVLQNTNKISVTVGVGGTGGTSSNGAPTAGSSSSFGSIVTAPGGEATGNIMGLASGGDGGYSPMFNKPFARGAPRGSTSNDSGGSGGLSDAPNNGSPGIVPFGGTPAGGGGRFLSGNANVSSIGGGSGGHGYGAGGGAGASYARGGNGASGLVIVTW